VSRSLPFGLSVALSVATAFMLGLTGCEHEHDFEEAECPPGGTELSYENFGKPFKDRYCHSCHASGAPDRHGAPAEFAFDDLDSVVRHAEHIYGRSAGDNASMPPGPDDPPYEEREALEEWLACGAPSEEELAQ
jgi:hypothetical protein